MYNWQKNSKHTYLMYAIQGVFIQCIAYSRSVHLVQKQSFLALDVALNAAHKGPHGRVVTLEQ